MKAVFVIVVALLCAHALAFSVSFQKALLSAPQPERDAVLANDFKWDVCDGAKGAVVVSASVTPSPIILGDNVTAKGAVKLNQKFDASTITHVKVLLQRKVFGVYVTIPCISNAGSCDYQSNGCDLLELYKDQICPILKPLGLPCQCPFAAQTYYSPKDGVTALTENIGSEANGDYYVKLVLANGKDEYMCTEAYFSLLAAK